MKPIIEQVLARVMTLSAALIVALMPVHAFLSTWLGTAIGPLLVWKSWKEILLLGLVPAVVCYGVLRPDILWLVWRRKVNQLIVLYVLLHVALSFSSIASTNAVIAGLLMNLRFLGLFVLVQIVAEAQPGLMERFKRWSSSWLLWVMVGLGIVAILQVFVLPKEFLVQFGYNKDTTIAPFSLVDQNPEALRAFATLRGPNTLGAYLLLPIAVALGMLYRRPRKAMVWVALGFGLVAVLLSGSRSAWLGLLVTLCALALVEVPGQRLRQWLKWGTLPAVAIAAVIGWAAITVPAVRLAVFHSSPDDTTLIEGSSEKHWEATASGINDVVRHPWGSGPGSAGPASFYNTSGVHLSENYFVQIAQEVGVIGLGLFIAISILTVQAIVRRRSDLLAASLVASLAGITIVNLLLHGWADDPLALTWWALAGLFMSEPKK